MNDALELELELIKRRGNLRSLTPRGRECTPWIDIDGTSYVNFGSNDYLGLAHHPDVIAAAVQATHDWGAGATGSRLTTGDFALVAKLESALATFKNTEDCVVFGSGYAANIGTIPALAGSEDLILSDRLNHASLIDACRLSSATVRVYAHGDADFASALLQDRAQFRRLLVVTDGVFSMDGDLAPLKDLSTICEQYDGWLVVDDAHGTGVIGPNGTGTAAHFGCADSVAVNIGTLSKAMGSAGGYVAGTAILCDYLRNTARSFIYSTAPVPAAIGGAIKALEIMSTDGTVLESLWRNVALFRERVGAYGLAALHSESAIQAVVLGDSDHAVEASNRLRSNGIWAPAIRPPTVPEGTARLRICPTAAHTLKQIEQCAAAVSEQALVGLMVADDA